MNRGLLIVPGLVGVLLLLASACGDSSPPPQDTVPTVPTISPVVALGHALAQDNGCLGCHSIDGSPLIGPTWKGVYGREETLTDGTTVTVDDEYIRESIVDPNIKIVQNFTHNLMPRTFGETLSESDIDAIIAYIKTLQ